MNPQTEHVYQEFQANMLEFAKRLEHDETHDKPQDDCYWCEFIIEQEGEALDVS